MRVNFRTLSITVLIGLALAIQFIAPGSPDYVVPLLPECLLISAIGFLFAPRKGSEASGFETLALRKSEFSWIILLFGILIFWIGPRVGMSLIQGEALPCKQAAPSLITRAECFLQAAYVQNYSVRQLVTLLLALYAGGMAALAVRMSKDTWKTFATVIVGIAVVHVSIGFVTRLMATSQILPKWLMVNSFGMDRFTFVMPNPSWVWPQLAPAMAWCLWLSSRGSKIWKLFSIALAAAISIGIFMTHQRGGLLLLAVLWGLWLSNNLWRRLTARVSRKLFQFVLVGSWLLALLLAGKVFLHWSTVAVGRATFHDDNRWTMWKVAIAGLVKESPLWGFGYASWYSKFKDVAHTANVPFLSFDTAHNLWVQILFEHGIVGASLIVLAQFGALLLAYRNCRNLENGTLLVSLHALAFLGCSIVQEIDYIRPVLMTHALSWGVLIGMPYYWNNEKTLSVDKKDYFFISPNGATPKNIFHVRLAMRVIAAEALLIACLAWVWFARGAYGFEGNKTQNGPMARWLDAQAVIPVFGPQPFWLFEADFKQKVGAFELPGHEQGRLRIEVRQEEFSFLPLKAGNRIVPNRHKILSEPAIDDSIRQITANIVFPPRAGKALLPLLLTRGASRPNQNGNSSWVECERDCSIALDSTLMGNNILVLSIDRNAIAPKDRIQWNVKTFSTSTVNLSKKDNLPAITVNSGTLNQLNSNFLIDPSKLKSDGARWTLIEVDSIKAGQKVKLTMKSANEGNAQ